MSPNRRIALNFVATYGRSLYAIAIGLLCGRWTLMALGEVDYGLMGLIGGMTGFISFVNSLMSTAVSRFFAYSVGAAGVNGETGLEDCRKWFNVALVIHTVIPVFLLVGGYPVGEWAVRRFLTIPADRVGDCIWVWRFVCISCFLSMVSVPFNAMYTAKQYIAELTIYSFVTTTLNACFLYYMITHPGVWLVKLSLWTCLLGIAPQILIAARACWIFPECRIVPAYMMDKRRIKEIAIYAFYRFFGALGLLVSGQGIPILVNKVLGPAKNAAMSVAGAVSGHCASLSGCFLAALSPAITNAYGARDMDRVRKLSFAACKLTTVMILIFALPLALEAEEVFRLWLVHPPEGSICVCLGLLAFLVVEKLSCGHYIAIFADGNIRNYQICCLCCYILVLPFVWLLMRFGMGIMSIAIALPLRQVAILSVRLYFGKKICDFSAYKWAKEVLLPIVACAFVALMFGVIICFFFEQSVFRIAMTTMATNLVFLPLGWFLILGARERALVRDRVFARLHFGRVS